VDLRSLGGDIVVLSTVVAEKVVWVILTTPTTQVAGRTKIEAAELNRKVLGFREVLSDPRADPRALARELYGILVGPVEKDLAGAAPKTIAWVLDGALRYLPVSALFDGKRYLVQRFASVELTLASRSRVALQPSATWRALGLGVTEAHEGFDALPGVADELRAVVREEGTTDTKGALPGRRLLDRDFTRQALESGQEAGYPVVHIASHFVFRPGNASDSFLLLGDGSHLTVEDIRSEGEPLFRGAELLTLSACETAMGGERGDGREVEGLGVEAQNQGAQAVLATLWPVEDESTAELMAGFYRQRQEQGLSKAEALREAQLALLEGRPGATVAAQGRRGAIPAGGDVLARAGAPRFAFDPAKPYAHPYFWAPFILMGNWR
jgi:CHAT domain-containing protein